MITVIDYDSGNLQSVCNALDRLGATYCLGSDSESLEKASKVIFPGQGAAGQAMKALKQHGLEKAIRNLKVPYLGICIGMQLLYEFSEEDDTKALGIVSGRLNRFQSSTLKVPQMGWNAVKYLGAPELFAGIPDESYFYFVHSYAVGLSGETAAVSFYGQPFAAALQFENFWGVQFHPEKSGKVGEQLLRNFLNL